MRWQEKQDRIETAVYDAMNELSDILSIPLSRYPEVFWLGRRLTFDDLALPEYLRDELEFRRAQGVSYYITHHKIVIIAGEVTNPVIWEEAAHAFHLLCSDISSHGRSAKDITCLAILVEALGFLGSRLLGSDLENPYEDFPDLATLTKQSQLTVGKIITDIMGNIDFSNFFIHQQGYGLGDRIYFKYLSGEISIGRIRKMFLSKFAQKDGAINAFTKLKNEFWSQKK